MLAKNYLNSSRKGSIWDKFHWDFIIHRTTKNVPVITVVIDLDAMLLSDDFTSNSPKNVLKKLKKMMTFDYPIIGSAFKISPGQSESFKRKD